MNSDKKTSKSLGFMWVREFIFDGRMKKSVGLV